MDEDGKHIYRIGILDMITNRVGVLGGLFLLGRMGGRPGQDFTIYIS